MTMLAQIRRSFLVAISILVGMPAVALASPTFTVLQSYKSESELGAQISGLSSDGEGHTYLTTQTGSQPTRLMQLTAPASGTTWSERTLYTFDIPALSFAAPVLLPSAEGLGLSVFVTSIAFDATISSIIEVSESFWNSWNANVIYTFPTCVAPATLQAGPGGVLYGTTFPFSYTSDCPGVGETVFSLTHTSSGTWQYATLASFASPLILGQQLVISPTGVVYGSISPQYLSTTPLGAHDRGYVFSLTPGAGGWSREKIYSFKGQEDGAFPGGLSTDLYGNLYGTTQAGGDLTQCLLGFYNGCGTIFQLIPPGAGQTKWVLNPLHLFAQNHLGQSPGPGVLTLAPSGALFGTTNLNGTDGLGTIFKFALSHEGQPTYSALYNFINPNFYQTNVANLLLDPVSGVLFGTTQTVASPATMFSLTQR
jgi:hypothetical protein